MMKLNLMKRFFDSVDSDWRSPIADEIALRWFASETFQAACMRASANFAFHVQAGDQSYFLRLSHASEREAGFISAELAFIMHLAQAGIRVAKPLSSLAGNLIENVDTPLGVFHAVLFEFLPGQELEFASLSSDEFKRWGGALGQLHQASQGFKLEGRTDPRSQLEFVRQIVPRNEGAVWKELRAVEEGLRKLPVDESNYGLIHYDFQLDNLVWSGDEIGIFDLDDCASGWFAMDVAYAIIRDLCDDQAERIDLAEPRLGWFLDGYRSVRNLKAEEVRWMPLLMRLHNLVSFARVYRSIAGGPLENEPQWTTELRQKLNKELDKYRQSFWHYPLNSILFGGL